MNNETTQNPNANHRARLKKRFEKTGIESLQSHEILEMLLFYSIKRKDTKPVARQLLKEFGSLSRVFDAPVEELIKVDGVGRETALLINFCAQSFVAYRKDLAERKNKISVADADESMEFAKSLFYGKRHEEFYVILLDSRLKVINHVFIAEGIGSEVNVQPKKILEALVRNNAESVIFAHNHLSGFPNPSRSDIDFTNNMISMLAPFGIKVQDHIIVSAESCYSFKRKNMIP